MKETIAVWFSCGAASAVAAKKTIEIYGETHKIHIVNSPIAEEDPDNRRFAADVAQWLGVEIEQAINPKYPDCSIVTVFDKRQYMGGIAGAPCTAELKKEARRHWEKSNQVDWHVLGFTADEKHRFDRFVLTERSNVLPVLIDAGLTKADCFQIIAEAGIEPPAIYKRGYPNANCIGCVKATSPEYWNHVRRKDPEVFAARVEQSRRIGAKLVRYRGGRIFLDELPPSAKGEPMRNMNHECGLFCEIK